MRDTIKMLFENGFRALGRALGVAAAGLIWPVLAAHGWYQGRSLRLRAGVLSLLALLILSYGYFIWQAEVWTNFNPDMVAAYKFEDQTVAAGQELPQAAGATAKTCQPSGVVRVTSDLIDFNVNQNAWISSMLLYRLGLFGMDWDRTPFLDNKANFQRGVNQAIRRTSVELVDLLGRMRGTSSINNNLQDARGNLQFDEFGWYFGLSPFGPKTPAPAYYRAAMRSLQKYNDELATCAAIFDGRADNLQGFLDRIASDLGSTSAMLRDRSENYAMGWFDTRADDRFWFSYGQLYGYYAVLSAAEADFRPVLNEKNLHPMWVEMLKQFRSALRIQPLIISNGAEDGFIMPNHLATMGFYILRVRSNLVEIRSVLER